MRIFTTILFFLFAQTCFAQNTKAIKLYKKADETWTNACKITDEKPNLEKEKQKRAKGSTKAIKYLISATKLDANYAEAWALLAYLYEYKKDTSNACKSYRMSIKADPLYQSAYYYYAQYLYGLNRYEEAISALEQFQNVSLDPKFNKKKDGASAKVTKDAAKLLISSKFAKEDAENAAVLNIQNMGPGINSKTYEYWPGMTIDGKYFIFTRLVDGRPPDYPGQEDFYESVRQDSVWSKAISLPGSINTPKNEGNTSVTADGLNIFYTVCEDRNRNYNEATEGFGSCDIYYSKYSASNGNWSKRINLGSKLNSPDWDAHPAISADGKSIIFASARPGGFGGMDLWTSHFANGDWTAPTNMGIKINTPDNESAPFLHYDGKTLYFSSNGHPGLGGQDLFLSRKGLDGTWSDPINLGKGMNTDADEVGLYVEYSGKKGYFSSDRPGGFGGVDIYSFDLPVEKRPKVVSYVLGNILDADSKLELSGRIEVVDLKTSQVIVKDSAFNFFTTVEPGGNYALNVYRQGYLFYSANFQPTNGSVDSPYVVTALLKALRNDQKIVLNNIFFDVDKFDIKTESYSELETVLALLRANPKMQIAIEGYTDNSGSDAHNQELSENRAKSVKQYLVGKGIAVNRISSKGFGSLQPLADNATAEGRALNRRIEMRVTAL